jgi:DNA-directed RNA polymerase specialized sigma24 family protein
VLYFVARRLLACSEASALSKTLAKDAAQRCWLTASGNPPKFPYVAFRSWLVRILIDVALVIRRTNCEEHIAVEYTVRISGWATTAKLVKRCQQGKSTFSDRAVARSA